MIKSTLNKFQFLALAITLVGILFVATTVTSQSTVSGTQWEYLTLTYQQLLGTELVFVDKEPYQTELEVIANQAFEQREPKGRTFYLDALGDDGWELVDVDNTSDQSTYRVDMIFKRPKPQN